MPRLPSFSSLALSSLDSLFARISLRLTIVGIISSMLIYIPNYFFLQLLTAEQSARILISLGYPSFVENLGNAILLNNFEVTRECTGIQGIVPIAVFLSAMPGIRRTRKVLAVLSAGYTIYLANILRITLELAIYSSGILSWPLIHDEIGFGFSVASVVVTLFLAGRIVAPNGVQDLAKTLLR